MGIITKGFLYLQYNKINITLLELIEQLETLQDNKTITNNKNTNIYPIKYQYIFFQ